MTWLRGNDQDREAGAPETAVTEVAVASEPDPAAALVAPLGRWGGRGNVVAAAGVMLVELLERA